jgi:2-polyprenyl-6-methoxyphenol hydroxylase-like FAD-dependent oxidoreductase
VIDYFEHDEKAGVILEDGSKLVADVVVAADGIGSRSWNIVSGFKETPSSSDFAMFRATYPAEHALKRPLVAEKFGDDPEKGFIIV